jgi:hypothetical protein
MLSIVHPQAQDLHIQQQQLQQQLPPPPPATFVHRDLPIMPHRVQQPELARTLSDTSSTTPSSPSPSIISSSSKSTCDASVVQALEIARESPDGGSDPTVSKILEGAIAQIWGRVQSQPDSYIMSRDEFSIFNYFQHRFVDNSTARMARKRYWDNMSA